MVERESVEEPEAIVAIRARLVDGARWNAAAVVPTALATLALLAIVADDLSYPRSIPLPAAASGFAVVSLLMALAAVGPWLAPVRRPRSARVVVGEGKVRIDGRVLRDVEVEAVSVARAARGASVAITARKGARLTFLEVASLEEAALVARALGAPPTPRELSGALPSRAGVAAQGVASALVVLSGAIWMAGAFGLAPIGLATTFKMVGAVSVVLAPVCLVILLARLAPGRPRPLSTLALEGRREATAFDRHVALHARAADEGLVSPDEGMGAPAVLLRQGEDTRAWLERLDALPVHRSAYRGDAMSREALLETLADDEATVDARAGAARVLARRLGEPAPQLVRVVTDPEVRVRVEAAALEEDPEEAATELDRLGPVFRAR